MEKESEKKVIGKVWYFTPLENRPILYEFMITNMGELWVRFRNPNIVEHVCTPLLLAMYYKAMERGEMVTV